MRALTTIAAASLTMLAACGSDSPTASSTIVDGNKPPSLAVVGRGIVGNQYTSEVWVQNGYAYTTTWGRRGASVGNTVRVWDVRADAPALVTSFDVDGASTTGDVQVSDDGTLLVVAAEYAPGTVAIYSLADPARPALLTQYTSASTAPGVHTAEVARVNGRLYAFLSVDPTGTVPAKLVILDLANPAAPVEVFSQAMGAPYVHDVFVRDGVLFTALWNEGLAIWDVGGLGRGGSPAAPVRVSTTPSVGGQVHNLWWLRDATTGAKRYAILGQEGAGSIGSSSLGDVHVMDVSDVAAPREVAFFHVDGAGPHNFSVDETNGVLYAAYYNAGVIAIDVRGDLGSCTEVQKSGTRCNLGLMGRELARGPVGQGAVYVWGVKLDGGFLYASDMLNGLWKLRALPAR